MNLNVVKTQYRSVHAPALATTVSRAGHDVLGLNVGGTGPWQGVSMDDLSFIRDQYATPNTLNKVGEESNNTIAPVASGSDFPHLVVLDFAQDVTLGREEVGQSRPTTVPIRSGWSLSQCLVLLDSGACVPMPFLMSLKVLELSSPGVTIDPIAPATPGQLSAVV